MQEQNVDTQSREGQQRGGETLTIDRKEGNGSPGGVITIAEDVVATIAGLAARDVPGIYAMGKSRFISFGDAPTRGVGVEVGNREAAFDLDVVIEYGSDLRSVADELRKRIGVEVKKMAGREVIEVNIHVVDVHLPDAGPAPKEDERRRVQ